MTDLKSRSILYNETLNLLKNRPRELTLDQIALETSLSKAWLKSLSQGRIDPSAGRLEQLFRFLSGRELKV